MSSLYRRPYDRERIIKICYLAQTGPHADRDVRLH